MRFVIRYSQSLKNGREVNILNLETMNVSWVAQTQTSFNRRFPSVTLILSLRTTFVFPILVLLPKYLVLLPKYQFIHPTRVPLLFSIPLYYEFAAPSQITYCVAGLKFYEA